MNSQSSSAAARRRHTGPNLGMVATVYVLPKIASVFPVSAFGSKPPFFPGLNAPTEAVVSYFSTRAHAVLICAFLQLGAAIPFGIFPGFTMPFALLMAGVSVTAGLLKLLPKGLLAFGLLLALTGELSWLSIVIPQADFLIPLTRWLGFVWLIVAGFKLPKTTAPNAIAGSRG